MITIAIANQKGGVASTTNAINLASSLADRGRRTLLVDLDSHANVSISFSIVELDSSRSNVAVYGGSPA